MAKIFQSYLDERGNNKIQITKDGVIIFTSVKEVFSC